MDEPLQVTIVAHHVEPIGGMERQLSELIMGLVDRGHQVTVIARRCDLPSRGALRWIRIGGPSRPFPIAYPWFFLLGTWQVWRHQAGLLHTTGAIVWNRADVSTVHYCHHALRTTADRGYGHGSGVMRRLNSRLSERMAWLAERWIYRRSGVRQLVGVSEGVAREVREHFPEINGRLAVIPLGVDSRTFRPDAAERRRIRKAYGLSDYHFVALFVGGDWERKGLALAIQAVAATKGCHLLVVGSGEVSRFRNIAQRLDAKDRIHFMGPHRNPAPFYAAADTFLLPSAYETFSLVTYEAAAAALPLLVTRVSGVEQILTDGHNGWFVQRHAGDIASRLRALEADEGLQKLMGARSREAVATYSWPRMVSEYERLYRRLTGPSNADQLAGSSHEPRDQPSRESCAH